MPRKKVTTRPRRVYADTRLGQMHLKLWPGPADSSLPPLVCLHPAPYSGRYYDTFAAALADRVSVIVPDLMGYGSSDELAEPAPIEEHALAIADALQAAGIGRFVPMGFHTGAAVAGELALARPKKVSRLIFITYPYLDAEERAKQLHGLGRGEINGEQLESLRRRWRFTVNNRAAGVPLDAAVNNFIEELRAGERAWFGFHSTFSYASEERLPRISQPVLVINVDGSMKEATHAAAGLLPLVHYAEFFHMNRGIFELHAAQLAAACAQFLEARAEDLETTT